MREWREYSLTGNLNKKEIATKRNKFVYKGYFTV